MRFKWSSTISGAVLVWLLMLLPVMLVNFFFDAISGDLAGWIALAGALVGGIFGFFLVGRVTAGRRARHLLVTVLNAWVIGIGLGILTAPSFIPVPGTDVLFGMLITALVLLLVLAVQALVGGLLSLVGKGRQSKAAFAASSPQGGRALTLAVLLPLLLLIVLSGLTVLSARDHEDEERKRQADKRAKIALRMLATYQEEYYANYGSYTRDMKRLREELGMRVDNDIQLRIAGVEGETWMGEATADLSGHTFRWHTGRGGLQEAP